MCICIEEWQWICESFIVVAASASLCHCNLISNFTKYGNILCSPKVFVLGIVKRWIIRTLNAQSMVLVVLKFSMHAFKRNKMPLCIGVVFNTKILIHTPRKIHMIPYRHLSRNISKVIVEDFRGKMCQKICILDMWFSGEKTYQWKVVEARYLYIMSIRTWSNNRGREFDWLYYSKF